jgi:hypothetical protein
MLKWEGNIVEIIEVPDFVSICLEFENTQKN